MLAWHAGPPPSWRARTSFLIGLLLLLFAVLAHRITTLVLVQGEEHQQRARLNTLVDEPIAAARGRFYDRKGRLLVTSTPVYDLLVIPAELRRPGSELRALARASGQNPEAFLARYRKAIRSAPLEELVLLRALNEQSLTRLVPLVKEMRGGYVRARGERHYRYGKTASHLFGSMGAITAEELRDLRSQGYSGQDFLGKTGLDKQYESLLRGAKGIRQLSVDAAGRTLSERVTRSPVPGHDLQLSLDMQLQLTTERALAQSLAQLAAKNGVPSAAAATVLKVDSGQILAMASLPNFDPRPFARGVSGKEYSALLNDPLTPLVNRASGSAYSPGSTFKMVTGLAALQAGLAYPHSVFHCGGSYGNANCFVTSGHGSISFHDSLAHSCDVVYYSLGDRMGIGHLAKYARSFGLGERSGVDLPGEEPGLIPDAAWKERVWEEPWYGGDTVNSSIGQGFVLTTPLQMAAVTASLANGGKLYQPYLGLRALNESGSVVWQREPTLRRTLKLAPEYLAAVRQGMRGAVTSGTGTALAAAPVAVAGKTGTVESFPSVLNPQGRNHTWFVCFAPYQKPEIAIAIAFEASGGYGGSVAAPVALEIVKEYFSNGKSPSKGRSK